MKADILHRNLTFLKNIIQIIFKIIAYDRVDWKKLLGILKKIGVDWKEKRLLSNLYTKQPIKVRIGEEMSEGRESGRRYSKGVLYRPHSSKSTWNI